MIGEVDLNYKELGKLSKEELIETIQSMGDIMKKQEDFLLNISHDLRNPINVILSILQCLKYLDVQSSEERYKKKEEYRGIIKRNVLKMVKLIDNLIDTTKLQGNYYKINKKNMDIVAFVENTVDSIEQYAQQKHIQLVFDTNVEECIIAFDPESMDRIVLNLLSNAIKYSPVNGTIYVYVDVDVHSVKISVKDEGPGILKSEQKAIFNRFIQSSNNKRDEHSGSGIGLDLVNYLTKMHDGRVELKSDYGHGSEFIVTIPNVKVKEECKNKQMIANNKIQQLEIEFSDIYL